jgi:hypothetical protein
LPITITYTVDSARSGFVGNDLNVFTNRIQSLFQRFGWEHVSQSQFRYPSSNATQTSITALFNRVVPALMCFKIFSISCGVYFDAITIHAIIDAAHNVNSSSAPPQLTFDPEPRNYLRQNKHSGVSIYTFGYKNLRQWLRRLQRNFPY